MIQDNLFIAHEIFHLLKRKDSRGRDYVALKLDMSKAYDRLEWEFLRRVLLAYGFCTEWVNLVMLMVTTVSYRYKINGFVSKKLTPSRGLRQGGPLSPYLFILAADVLSRMLLKAKEQGYIQEMNLTKDGPSITHLFFGDDSLLFAKATEEEMYQVINILNMYTNASGQMINTTKSGLIGGRFISHQVKLRLAGILSIQVWDNPGKYLGLPVEWSRKKINDLEWIREKVLGKIEGWKECLLNQEGKEVLIKAVIQAIPIYAMALVRLPKKFCRELCSRVARFWWSGYGKSRGIHWRKWEVLAQSKMEGGMGFKDFNHLNSAMLAKQAWRVLTNPNALWVSVFEKLLLSKL